MIAFEKQTYDLLDFSGPARIACSPYFRARCAALAPNMVLRVVLSTYDAFGRRFAGCALNVVASVCEALLAFHFVFALGWTLQGVGIASIAASTAVATVGLLAVPFFQPASARGRVRFYASTPVISQLVAFCSRASGMRSMRMNLLDESGEYAPPVSVYPSLMQGLDTMIRFLCLQGPIMAGTIYASRIGEGALVANHIALLVWMFTSPVIDGASIVCAPLAHDNISMRHFDSQRRLSYQLAAVGIIFGGICTAGFWFAKHAVLAVLLGGDPVDLSVLSNLTMVWLLISGMQVVNSIGSTYDGLLLASSQFSYVRNQLLFGGIAVFLPALIGELRTMPRFIELDWSIHWPHVVLAILRSPLPLPPSATVPHACPSPQWGTRSSATCTASGGLSRSSPCGGALPLLAWCTGACTRTRALPAAGVHPSALPAQSHPGPCLTEHTLSGDFV